MNRWKRTTFVIMFDEWIRLQSLCLHVCDVSVCVSCQMIIFIAVHVSAEVKSVSIDVGREEVLVESSLTSAEVLALIEGTGRRAVLKGIGGSAQGEKLQNRSL